MFTEAQKGQCAKPKEQGLRIKDQRIKESRNQGIKESRNLSIIISLKKIPKNKSDR
jgi:hypothetical protein